jgi:hypothetical protein
MASTLALRGGVARSQALHRQRTGGADGLGALGLGADSISLFERGTGECVDTRVQVVVLRGRQPLPGRIVGLGGKLPDGLDGRLHLPMAEHDALEHDFFGQLLRFGLHHQYGCRGSGNDQIELTLGLRRAVGVENMGAVDIADAHGTDGAGKGQAGNGDGCGGRDERRNIRIDFRIGREHLDDDLNLVGEAVGEQRSYGPVDQARGERFLFRGGALATEEAAGDTASRVCLLDVVDRQRKEVLSRLGFPGGHDGGQEYGVGDREQHRTRGLTSHLARFQGDRQFGDGQGGGLRVLPGTRRAALYDISGRKTSGREACTPGCRVGIYFRTTT